MNAEKANTKAENFFTLVTQRPKAIWLLRWY